MAPSDLPKHPVTPDGHYFVVRGRLWRCTNPHLSPEQRKRGVSELMRARRQVRMAQDDPDALKRARHDVHTAKLALGERGIPWWGDDTPTYDRKLAINTPYRDWFLGLSTRLEKPDV